ncbi:MAG: hypothetical protein EHM90_00405 [Chloroflexi bacterium]|nr:MAG: hypothetical protein EHM90_00405 [Chloroflexota bacterium]
MSEGVPAPQTDPRTVGEPSNGDGPMFLSASQLADRSRFKFRTKVVDLPEIGGKIEIRSLTIAEREQLPTLADMKDIDDKGERTEHAVASAAETFSVIVSNPEVSAAQAKEFLGSWPAEAFDRVVEEFGELVADGKEEQRIARDEFPAGVREDGD